VQISLFSKYTKLISMDIFLRAFAFVNTGVLKVNLKFYIFKQALILNSALLAVHIFSFQLSLWGIIGLYKNSP
jgi:hypothetical protein